MAAPACFLLLSLLCHRVTCLPAFHDVEFDEDGGRDQDIIDINEEAGLDLLEGDIVFDGDRNSILGDEYRWPTTVPYYLEDSLEINAKGVILKAFEQYRLKTCLDFKPWEGESHYLSVFKGTGCYSSVGKREAGKQGLSIGSGCDRLATVEHEFLHALGFWHEQSRADRDDYVTVVWDQITEGKEHNFKSYDDTRSSALNVPYDYGSVMHYGKGAFNKGSAPTLVTRIPEFMDAIGQRMEFSDSDVLKLNRLYNCSASSTFLDSCSFERSNVCGMVQGLSDDADWVRVTAVPGGPPADHTNMGQCKGAGFFMHFGTATGRPGDRALLETRLHYPKRGSQCLQFYLHSSGGALDRLDVGVREYDQLGPKGTLRYVKQIVAEKHHSWELHHVTLNASKKFRVVFEGAKGEEPSPGGGLSIDDVNLSEAECPHHQWRIRDFARLLAATPPGRKLYSPRFLSREGYAFQVGVYLNGTSGNPGKLGVYFHLVSGGELDGTLEWPCPWRQVTMTLADQNPDVRRQMSNQRSVTTDPGRYETDANGNREYFWDDPRKVGSLVTDGDGTRFYRGPGRGTSGFLTHERLKSRDFIKGGDAIFLFSLDDVSRFLKSQPLPRGNPCSAVHCGNQEVCKWDGKEAACRREGDDGRRGTRTRTRSRPR